MLKNIVALSLCAAFTSVVADCTYESLQQITSSFVSSQATGGFATTASSVTYTENYQDASIKTGILSKPLNVAFSRSIHDTTTCATFTEIIVTDPAHPYVVGTQLRLDGSVAGQPPSLSLIETIVTDEGDWLFNATGTYTWASQESWGPIPVEQRDTRETVQKAADAYLDLFNDPTVEVPWGTPCARLEGGLYTGQGLPTDSCNVGVPSGVPLTRRRYVIDETVGSVDVFLDFGNNKIPDTHEFRIEGGKIRFVHTMTATGGP